MSTTPTRSQTANRLVFLLEWATSVVLAPPVPWGQGLALAPLLRPTENRLGLAPRSLDLCSTTPLTLLVVVEVAQ